MCSNFRNIRKNFANRDGPSKDKCSWSDGGSLHGHLHEEKLKTNAKVISSLLGSRSDVYTPETQDEQMLIQLLPPPSAHPHLSRLHQRREEEEEGQRNLQQTATNNSPRHNAIEAINQDSSTLGTRLLRVKNTGK